MGGAYRLGCRGGIGARVEYGNPGRINVAFCSEVSGWERGLVAGVLSVTVDLFGTEMELEDSTVHDGLNSKKAHI